MNEFRTPLGDHITVNVTDRGPRSECHENDYGAYLLDPDGNNVEAVDHGIRRR